MMYRRMCICDVEPVYLRRLAAYLNRHPGFLWRIRTSANLGGCLQGSAGGFDCFRGGSDGI